MALFGGNSKKFLAELDSSSTDWAKLASLSKGGIHISEKARNSGKTIFQVLIDLIISKENIPTKDLEKIFSNLSRKGADLSIQMEPDGETALHMAVRNEMTRFVEILLSQGASPVAASGSGVTPLHLAAEKGMLTISELLVNAGADVNSEDSEGDTPLHYTVSEPGHAGLVEFLLSRGALAYVRNGKGLTPAAIAQKTGNKIYIEPLRHVVSSDRSRKSAEWTCPGCGSPLDLPASHMIDWYLSIGMWEYLCITCGRCGQVTEAPLLDG